MRDATTYLAIFLVGILLLSPVIHSIADLDYISFLGYLDPNRTWNTVYDLAGNRFEGRRAGTQGAELASEYVASYFNSIGLQPAGMNGTYRTRFTLPLWQLVEMPSLSLVESSRNVSRVFEYRRDFFVMPGSGSGDYSAEVVFGGYGITAESLGYDDYSGISAHGKIVLAIVGTPASDRFSQGDYGQTYEKAENALRHGAVGLILASSALHYVEEQSCGYCWTISNGLTVLGGSVEMADALMKDTGFTLTSLDRSISQAVRPHSIALGKELHVSVHASFTPNATAYNVLGFIPGSDAASAKVVIVGAHYDHWGKDVNGDIFRGAEDNGSGVAVMMEIARVFSAGVKPRSSILFAAWSGEEEGHYGSHAYVDHPYFSLARTIAYLNLDMVGAGNPLIFQSSEAHIALRAVTTDSAEQLGITIRIQGYEAISDHAVFEGQGVPNLLFYYWPYAEYHTPSDTADHISRANLLETERLTALIALKLSDATVTPAYATTVVSSSAVSESRSKSETVQGKQSVPSAMPLPIFLTAILLGTGVIVTLIVSVLVLRKRVHVEAPEASRTGSSSVEARLVCKACGCVNPEFVRSYCVRCGAKLDAD
jgi:hypothetical protein